MTTRPLQKRMKRCMTSVSLLCDRRKRSRPDHEQTTTMDHDRKMDLVNNDRDQKKHEETERKNMQDEDLSIDWRWVAQTSSAEDEEKIEEEWER